MCGLAITWLALFALSGTAFAEQAPLPPEPDIIEGLAVALDGDTIQIDGRRIRLFGIAAPEMTEALGPQARGRIDDTLATGPVRCAVVDTDRYKRPVAICKRGGVDLAKLLLESGLATTYRVFTYAEDADPDLAAHYDAAERSARLSGRGLWAANASTSRWNDPIVWAALVGPVLSAFLAASLTFRAALMLQGRNREYAKNALRAALAGELEQIGRDLREPEIRFKTVGGVSFWDVLLAGSDQALHPFLKDRTRHGFRKAIFEGNLGRLGELSYAEVRHLIWFYKAIDRYLDDAHDLLSDDHNWRWPPNARALLKRQIRLGHVARCFAARLRHIIRAPRH